MDKENVVYIYNEVSFGHKEERNYVACRKMDESRVLMLSETSQTEKHKYCMFFPIYRI
jgi:hypothetical protein